MTCRHYQQSLPADSNFCPACGTDQRQPTALPPFDPRQLRRSATKRKFAGVCGGIAEYVDIEVTIVRLIWVIVSIVPGAIFGGIAVYLLAWLIMPDSITSANARSDRRLTRSATNRKIAGICGGVGEYFGVDPTAARLLWTVLSIVPGFIIGGIAAYVIAWLVMPSPPTPSSDFTDTLQ